MVTDDAEFEQIYALLPPGLVLLACIAQPFEMPLPLSERMMTSFGLSLRGAANRLGSNVIDIYSEYSRRYWRMRGISQLNAAIEEYTAKDKARIFLFSRPVDTSIDCRIAGLIHQASLSKTVTVILKSNAGTLGTGKLGEGALAVREENTIHFNFTGSATIILEQHRANDNWYSAAVSNESGEKRFGPLYIYESSPPYESLPRPESEKIAHRPPERIRVSGIRRILRVLGFWKSAP